ncbi:hypothetical protein BES08_27735 (plasmid) [Novosphingobium resinovorum]|uniref:Uncharacterized protein n=1 Tax=Novosphingobium resinovorum TaxID=158500 RepID=A0A1D8AEU5_9SPHN|nr:hypothetical protein BES08_27735 [Novosphingobium resinovorum]
MIPNVHFFVTLLPFRMFIMWLVHRDTDGTGGNRIPLRHELQQALVRWYIGEGTETDEKAGIMLVQQARIGQRWIACGCLGADMRDCQEFRVWAGG